MKNKHLYIRLTIVFLVFLIVLFFYNSLPLEVPTHYDINGNVDDTIPKGLFVFLFPLVMGAYFLFIYFVKNIDPKSENYNKFGKTWEVLQYSILFFVIYIYFLNIYFTFNPGNNIGNFISFGLGVFFIIIGNYMGKIKQNYFIGFRLPWTLDNEEVWNKTHRFGGKLFVLTGVLVLVNSFINFYLFFVFFVCLILSTLITILFSYFKFKELKRD